MSMLDKLKVLIVDDTSTSRMLLREGLIEVGIQNIVQAKDGAEALNIMKTSPCHLIVSDFHMPKIDGLQLLQSIRMNGPTQRVPFILLTGAGDKTVLQRAAKLGLNNYITKPFTVPTLKNAIQAIFGKF